MNDKSNTMSLMADNSTIRMYLFARNAETFFFQDEKKAIHRCSLGNPPTCSCQSQSKGNFDQIRTPNLPPIIKSIDQPEGRIPVSTVERFLCDEEMPKPALEVQLKKRELESSVLCEHLIFCMNKVLMIPKNHSLYHEHGWNEKEV